MEGALELSQNGLGRLTIQELTLGGCGNLKSEAKKSELKVTNLVIFSYLQPLKITLMRVIAKKILRDFWEKHVDSEEQLKTWFQEASKANWTSPAGIKSYYVKASILKSGRVVFNICGNKYRLIVDINYPKQWMFIRFIGTHNAYDKIDADNI